MDDPRLNVPASGTYGEGKAQADLQAQLPTGAPAGGGAPQAAPMPPINPANAIPAAPPVQPEGRPQTGATPPPGVPAVLAAPTQQPGVPLTTPLGQGPQIPQQPDEARLALLQVLASSPDVAQVTRDWARQVMSLIMGQQNQNQ